MTVQAESLAAICGLASNPPERPETSTGESGLTLYIVRVPGSRDIFLSPLKPGDRIVHAQDVQRSLYFLHVNDDQADALISDSPRETSPSCNERPAHQIPRKPTSAQTRKPVQRRPLPTPPSSPPQQYTEPLPAYRPLDALPEVPVRKPLVPPRSPKRESATSPTAEPAQLHRLSVGSAEEQTCPSMTLIRRDPSTGGQSNIATISDPPIDEVSSEVSVTSPSQSRRIKNSGSPLYIDLQNPAYDKFSMSSPLRVDSGADPRRTSTTTLPDPATRTFRRRLWMDASRHANHTYSNRRPLSIGPFGTTSPPLNTSRPLLSPTATDSRTKGYAFHDPWGGKCVFSTATTGKALRCRRLHQCAGPESEAAWDDISELRFNLPNQHLRSKSDLSIQQTDIRGKRGSIFSQQSLPAASNRTGSVSDEDGSVDYSLGRERAGGGFAGREPKLGKLIIYPQGLQMIDLVVAANLALWWRAYERSSQH